MVYLSAWRAERGKCSLICIPGTLVVIGLNSPRISAGASGLRSQVSCCAGPPRMNNKMHDLAVPKPPVDGLAAAHVRPRNNSGKAMPAVPRLPIWRKSRREMPSHKRYPEPRIFSIGKSPEIGLHPCATIQRLAKKLRAFPLDKWKPAKLSEADYFFALSTITQGSKSSALEFSPGVGSN